MRPSTHGWASSRSRSPSLIQPCGPSCRPKSPPAYRLPNASACGWHSTEPRQRTQCLAVVDELQRQRVVALLLLERLDDDLQLVLVLAGDADEVTLDLRCDLLEVGADRLGDL